MWKKAVPAIALSSVLLVGCNMNDNDKAVPSNNETPMEDVREGVDDMTPDLTPEVNTPSPTNKNDNNYNNNNNDGINGTNGTTNGIDNVQPGVQDETVPNDTNTLNETNTDNGQMIKKDIKEK